ncbi:GDP-mannose 4,6 dehydratase, putative [Eimeria maxima]|uniref:GDP-mannose 4,6-dehydratase n=1 Tax=Eimeria maxima TaxID=5804 RepID=U6MBM8_EIMMA|nr:GDP-mannose 4,6 dehydratase, putative [Eimeria maxima]CDJ59040.1 GDP-mannose 4,6 dehydratase, putative [Eimeria maxima]
MTTLRRALITGITGQDGSGEHIGLGGAPGLNDSPAAASVPALFAGLHLHCGDVVDSTSLFDIISRVRPHEVYNLAAQSHVKVSFDMPIQTTESTAVGVLRVLDAIRAAGLANETRVFQASSSEMFGSSSVDLQNEETPFKPCSPYGVSKLYGHFTVQTYRSAYGIFCVSGILFNHESPRRGTTFVSRKITMGIASILKGERLCLELGNLDARRDWGHSRDYVKSMWLMLQQKVPKDYVVATGKQHSVREFCQLAFAIANLPLQWKGKGLQEVGSCGGRILVRVSSAHFRPTEVDALKGDASRIRSELNWRPETTFTVRFAPSTNSSTTNFSGGTVELVFEMLQCDMRLAGLHPPTLSECNQRIANHIGDAAELLFD